MLRYIGKRVFMMLFVILGVVILVFSLLYITPGDPARLILGATATDAQVSALRLKLGLDDPYFVRLGKYLYNLVTKFDLGTSFRTGESVTAEIARRFPVTMTLGILGLAVSTFIGIITGIFSAVKQYTWTDKISNLVAVVCASMPAFWFAMELCILFALKLRWLPATGIDQGVRSYVLPVLTMGLTGAAGTFRFTRSSMLDCIRMDYVQTARAKGQNEFKVITHHVLKNAMIPIITLVGNGLGYIIAGSVVIESVFSIPGIGSNMLLAISTRDYPIIQGSVLILAISISVFNLFADLAYALFDPRISAQFKRSSAKSGGKRYA